MPLRSGPSWCEIGGLAAAAHIMQKIGGIYINFEKNMAVGVDGVSVEKFRLEGDKIQVTLKSLLAALHKPFGEPFTTEMRIEGLTNGNYQLIINGNKALDASDKELSHLKVEVECNGLITYDREIIKIDSARIREFISGHFN